MNNNNNNEPPLQFPFLPNKEQIRSFKRTIPISIYDFYIIDDIGEPDKYLDLIQTLRTAEPQDTIFLYLNTLGGNLYTTIQILSAMSVSNAKIITCLEGQVCSAGTFIFLKGDTKVVNPNGTFMAHNYSQATSGKGNEVITQVTYMEEYFAKLAIDIYGDFLTEEEIDKVVGGDDLWLHSNDVVDRLEKNGHDFVYTGKDEEVDVKVDVKPIKTSKKRTSTTTKKRITKKKTTRKT